MSGCVSDRLGDYLEGDLGVQERGRVEAHLIDCARCRDELRGLRATVALLRRLPTPAPPRDLTPAVMARIESERERRSGWMPAALRSLDGPGVPGLLAAGLACLALVGLWQAGGTDPDAPTSKLAPERMALRKPPRVTRSNGLADRPFGTWPPAARAASLAGGVAPLGGFAELPTTNPSQRQRELERQLDRQLERLMVDPAAFLSRMGPDVRGEGFARLAQHAARRGAAGQVASRLIAVSHPLADDLAPRFLAASLAADFERNAGLR